MTIDVPFTLRYGGKNDAKSVNYRKEGTLMKKTLTLLLVCCLLLGCLAGAAYADEPKQISYWIDVQQGSSMINSFAELACWQQVEKNLGVQIKWEHPAIGQGTEQFNLIMASSDLPDIMYYTWTDSYPGGPEAAIADGKIIALNDYIDEYAPNLKAYLEAHDDIRREITTDEGHIYCFPMVYTNTSADSPVWQGGQEREPYYESFMGLIIRKDWLDDLGLEIPKTLDDWYVTLKAFKEEKGAEYPLSCISMFLDLSDSFASAYDVSVPVTFTGGGTVFSIDKEGKVKYGMTGEGYYNYLVFMNKLYTEGLLDPDFMVQDRTTVQSKIANDKVGAWIEMMPAGIGTLRNQRLQDNPNDPFYPIGVLNPVANENDELYYFQASYPFRAAGAAITTGCKDIETAMRVCDYLWSDEGSALMNWGIEGESYEMVDGWPHLTDALINNDKGLTPSNAFDFYYQLNGPFAADHANRIASKTNYRLAEGETDESLAALDTWSRNGQAPVGLPGGATLLSEETSEYASLYNELSTYADEMRTKFIMGYESLENYDKYEKTLRQFGLERVLELKQNSLDRYNAR